MELEADTIKPAINRLKRAQGQLNAVIRMMEEGSDCRSVVTQLSAASKAIDRAGFSIIATGLEQCLKSENPTSDKADLEKLFLSLA
ncbi:metal-sensitive transcriptional regulator [Glutamicibacter sp. AOP5-A2-7]